MASSAAGRAVALSYDSHTIRHGTGKHGAAVQFVYSLRDAGGASIESFNTELHLPLRARPLTAAEELLLTCYGVCHATYVWLPFMPQVSLLEVRASYLDPDALLYLEQQLSGALAEWFFLTDVDAAGRVRLTCCCESDKPRAMFQSGEVAGEILQRSCGPPRVIVPFGGGKDSTVLMELLHQMGCNTQWAYYGE
jgi:hypothetical protein